MYRDGTETLTRIAGIAGTEVLLLAGVVLDPPDPHNI